MKTRILGVILVVLVLSVLFVSGQAQAQVPSAALSVVAVDELFTALNAGDIDLAAASFGFGAAVQELEGWHKEGRQYSVLGDEVTSLFSGMDIVTSDVEISDRGVAWARETVRSVVYDGLIQKLYVTDIELTPSQYW